MSRLVLLMPTGERVTGRATLLGEDGIMNGSLDVFERARVRPQRRRPRGAPVEARPVAAVASPCRLRQGEVAFVPFFRRTGD
jgi:hypothetical protein